MESVQTSLLAFETAECQAGRRWLEGHDGRRDLCRTDAEALVESLNAMPTGKGMWLRCLEIDKNASYNSWCRGWSARIWWQNGIGLEKLVDHEGNAKDFIDPYPLSHHYHEGKQFRPIEHQEVRGARIEGDVLVLDLPSGEWAAEIHSDEEVRMYDRHPYDPSFDLEHLAIERYRNKLPEEMLAWREHYVYGTPALRPFSRTMTEEEAKRIDPMGRIPGILAPNGMFSQICECAERLGIRLRLSHDVPALANLSMHPNERTCKSCLRRGCSNWRETNPCWEGDRCGGCFGGYVWDRRAPSRRGRGGIPGCHGAGGARGHGPALPDAQGRTPAGDGRGSAWSSLELKQPLPRLFWGDEGAPRRPRSAASGSGRPWSHGGRERLGERIICSQVEASP